MIFRNFTTHVINIYDETGKFIIFSIAPEAESIRLEEEITETVILKNKIPIVTKKYKKIENLPFCKDFTIIIVSLPVIQALQGSRSDLVCSDTSKDSVVKDEKGNILGVKRFMRL